jgi:hypothetical protein
VVVVVVVVVVEVAVVVAAVVEVAVVVVVLESLTQGIRATRSWMQLTTMLNCLESWRRCSLSVELCRRSRRLSPDG